MRAPALPGHPAASRSGLLYAFCVATFLAFALREGFAGPLRYGLGLVRLDVLWFVPDMLGMLGLGVFFYRQLVERNAWGLFFVASFFFSVLVSIVFMNDNTFSLFASIKMFVPVFAGLCFFDRSITESPRVRAVLLLMFIGSAMGLILAPYVEYPWLSSTVTSFGVERSLTKTWWTGGGQVRYNGFSSESTIAAFVTIFLYFLVSPRLGLLANIVLGAMAWWAVTISTSKTAIGTLLIYFMMYPVLIWLGRWPGLLDLQRFAARCSFLTIALPVLLIAILGGSDPSDFPDILRSSFDRINDTWQLPFRHLREIFPAGLFFGCGVGCFAWPMESTALKDYNVAFDNFYLTTFIMLGYPAVVLVFLQFASIRYCRDHIRLTLMVLFNFYAVTIQNYGQSFGVLIFGYIFSGMFAMSALRREEEGARAEITPQPRRF